MLKIRNRYDHSGSIITPDDYGKREAPEGFIDFLVEMYTPIANPEETNNIVLFVDVDQKKAG